MDGFATVVCKVWDVGYVGEVVLLLLYLSPQSEFVW